MIPVNPPYANSDRDTLISNSISCTQLILIFLTRSSQKNKPGSSTVKPSCETENDKLVALNEYIENFYRSIHIKIV